MVGTAGVRPASVKVADTGVAPLAGGSDVASQQTFTAVGAEQQNPCGSNIASLFFDTQQAFAHCAGAGAVGSAPMAGAGSDAASQQTFTAVGAEQQNACGSHISSRFCDPQQAFARCAGASAGGVQTVGTAGVRPAWVKAADTGVAPLAGGSDVASQQTFTAVGAEQQSPCGSNIASLFFDTQQAFAHCGGSGAVGSAPMAGGGSDAASQQTFTAIGAE